MSIWGVAKLSTTSTLDGLSNICSKYAQETHKIRLTKTTAHRLDAPLHGISAAPSVRTQTNHLSICKCRSHVVFSLTKACKASNSFRDFK